MYVSDGCGSIVRCIDQARGWTTDISWVGSCQR